MFQGRPLWYTGASHILGYGPTRSGKFAGWLAYILKTYPGSIFVHDPAFEMAAVTADYRARFSDVYFINPMGTLTEYYSGSYLQSDGFNVMAAGPRDHRDPKFGLYYDELARMRTEYTPYNPFWYNSAVSLCSGFFEHERVVYGDRATLSGVRRRMAGWWEDPGTGEEEFRGVDRIIGDMFNDGTRSVRMKLADFTQNDETKRNIFKHVASEMGCFDFDDIRVDEERCINGNPYDFADAKKKCMTVYFGLPSTQRGCQAWKKLVLGSILRDLSKGPPGDFDPLIIVDEAAQMGAMEYMEDFCAFGAKHGGRGLWVYQSDGQVNKLFRENASVIRGSRGAMLALAPKDLHDAEMLRRTLGRKTEWRRSYGAHTMQNEQADANVTDTAATFNLMNDEDLLRMEGGIAFIDPVKKPIRIDTPHYYRDQEMLQGLAPNPYHELGVPEDDEDERQRELAYEERMAA